MKAMLNVFAGLAIILGFFLLWLFVVTPIAAWDWVAYRTGLKKYEPAPPFGWF